MKKYNFKLFIVSKTSIRNLKIISVIEELLKKHRGEEDDYALEIIDVLETPEKAVAYKILVTPTILREEPPPTRKVVGNLSDPKIASQALKMLRTEKLMRAAQGIKV